MPRPFITEALVDFIDDAILAQRPIGPAEIDSFILHLKNLGVRRVHWIYYGEASAPWLTPDRPLDPAGDPNSFANILCRYRETVGLLGNPLKVAADACRRHGLEIWGYYKPYEQGLSGAIPHGSPLAKEIGLLPNLTGQLVALAPFVAQNPTLRIRRRASEIVSANPNAPIRKLRLIKSDAAPTRIKRDNIQIWASENNWQYERVNVPFTLEEPIEPSALAVDDIWGNNVTAQNGERRVLTLSGLNLRQKYVLVTTDFTSGNADFENVGCHMLEAVGSDDCVIPGVFSNEMSFIYDLFTRDFRKHGLAFDNGWSNSRVKLDKPNADGHTGFIAFCRGREPYLPAGLCETNTKVRDFWLSQVREILDCGVDGIDFREENHCTHTDFADEYGFNDEVLAQTSRADIPGENRVAAVRGWAYTDFLKRARAMIVAEKKKMRVHLNIDWFRPKPERNRALAIPSNLDFNWRQWIDEGLLDEATLRAYVKPFQSLFFDAVAKEMIERCTEKKIPIYVQRYIHGNEENSYLRQFDETLKDRRFAGFQLYETSTFIKLDAAGQWQWTESGNMKKTIDALRPKIAAANGG